MKSKLNYKLTIIIYFLSDKIRNGRSRNDRIIIDMVVAARALAELRLVSVFARIPPTHHHHPH